VREFAVIMTVAAQAGKSSVLVRKGPNVNISRSCDSLSSSCLSRKTCPRFSDQRGISRERWNNVFVERRFAAFLLMLLEYDFRQRQEVKRDLGLEMVQIPKQATLSRLKIL
jgi:hypothetical protein